MPRRVARIPKMQCSNNTITVAIAVVIGVLLINFLPTILRSLSGLFKKEGFESKPASLEKDLEGGDKLVLFYADWCGHCKKMMPEWQKFQKEFNGKEGINIINVESEDKSIMKKHGIDGFPTIKYCPSGLNNPNDTQLYEGDRTFDGLVAFFNELIKN